MKDNLKTQILLQVAVLIYSIVSVMSKLSSTAMKSQGIFSLQFILLIGMMFLALGIYAIIWQRVLNKIDLSVAYSTKAMTLFWSLIWSILIFKEKVYINNVIGLVFIILGVVIMSR